MERFNLTALVTGEGLERDPNDTFTQALTRAQHQKCLGAFFLNVMQDHVGGDNDIFEPFGLKLGERSFVDVSLTINGVEVKLSKVFERLLADHDAYVAAEACKVLGEKAESVVAAANEFAESIRDRAATLFGRPVDDD